MGPSEEGLICLTSGFLHLPLEQLVQASLKDNSGVGGLWVCSSLASIFSQEVLSSGHNENMIFSFSLGKMHCGVFSNQVYLGFFLTSPFQYFSLLLLIFLIELVAGVLAYIYYQRVSWKVWVIFNFYYVLFIEMQQLNIRWRHGVRKSLIYETDPKSLRMLV